ncbi:hypothetical protein Tco_1063911, partial [Tanacetum coccineum]
MFLLQWIDSTCTCLLPRYLNLFHVIVYKVYTDGRPKISRHGRKATVNDFYAVILSSVELDNRRKEKSSELAISSQMNLPNCCHAHETARESDFGREVMAFDIRFVTAKTHL